MNARNAIINGTANLINAPVAALSCKSEILAVLPLTETSTNILGAAQPGGMGQLLQALTIVRDIVQSPLAATLAARFTGGQGQGSSQISQVIESGPHNLQPQLPAPQPAPQPAAAPAPVLDEKKFIEMLMTAAGREMMNKGLQQIKDLGGDMTISQMQELLKSGKPLEQKQ